MTDYVWKHLPFAIYLDTNALRSAGLNLDAQWINELLSITNKYGICGCVYLNLFFLNGASISSEC